VAFHANEQHVLQRILVIDSGRPLLGAGEDVSLSVVKGRSSDRIDVERLSAERFESDVRGGSSADAVADSGACIRRNLVTTFAGLDDLPRRSAVELGEIGDRRCSEIPSGCRLIAVLGEDAIVDAIAPTLLEGGIEIHCRCPATVTLVGHGHGNKGPVVLTCRRKTD